MSTTPRRSIVLTLLAIGGLLSTAPEARAALSFDLSENLPGFYGYSTRQVGAGQWTIGATEYSIGTTGTASLVDSGGNLTFTTSSLNGGATITADLNLFNTTSANPYGIDAINELHTWYSNIRSAPNVFVTMSFARPGSATFTEVGDLVFGSNNVLTTGQLISFQGETLADGLGGPLIENNNVDPGILRFTFTAAGFGAGNYTAQLLGTSITAVVPEPSSALLLTGVLGLFGTTFRRRRVLTAAGPSL